LTEGKLEELSMRIRDVIEFQSVYGRIERLVMGGMRLATEICTMIAAKDDFIWGAWLTARQKRD